ncbi:MAG: hypothetical protein JW731_16540 [Bacteroidales bacterium]|nr:hypothetical protein [Bacteroidales bacterium]
MELITLGIGYIVNTFVKNREVQSAVDDFVTGSVKMIRSWFVKKDKEPIIQKLEKEPESEEVKEQLNIELNEMVKDDQFKKMLESWVDECKKPFPSMKNVLENAQIEVGGHVNIGDKNGSDQVYDKKNVVANSTLKAGGDFSLGDIV